MKMLIGSIGSKRQAATLSFGAQVAKALSADTTLLGIVDGANSGERIKRALDRTAQVLDDEEVPVQVRVEAGHAEDVFLADMEQLTYDLVAFGALGGQRSRRSLFHPVFMRIIEQTNSSVLAIKGKRPRLSRVLVCSSGANHGHLPVWAGAAVACGAGARVTLLHVLGTMPAMYTGLERMEETMAEVLQSGTEMAEELRWGAQVVNAECGVAEVKLRRGIVADEILREGKVGDHDLIVLGSSKSASGLVRALMGNLTREVVNRAQRPVLVVRPLA